MSVLKSPRGFYHAFSNAESAYFATCIYKDLRNCNGDPKTWWKNEWPLYQEHVRQVIRYLERDGAPHFWERITMSVPIAQQVRAPEEPMEVEVIDLTRDDDVEIIYLTQDETDDEENDNEDEDSEMGYETQEDTEGPEIIDLTKDYV